MNISRKFDCVIFLGSGLLKIIKIRNFLVSAIITNHII